MSSDSTSQVASTCLWGISIVIDKRHKKCGQSEGESMRRLFCIGLLGTLLTNNAQSANFVFEHFDEPVGSAETPVETPRDKSSTKLSFEDFVNSELDFDEKFMGIYMGSLRLGEFFHVVEDLRSNEDQVIKARMSMTMRDGDEAEDSIFQQTLVFDSDSPFRLRTLKEVEQKGDQEQIITISRIQGNKYEAAIEQNSTARKVELEINFFLSDQLAEEFAIACGATEGALFSYNMLDLEGLYFGSDINEDKVVATFHEVSDAQIQIQAKSDGYMHTSRYDPKGKVLGYTQMGIEFRVEDKGSSYSNAPDYVLSNLSYLEAVGELAYAPTVTSMTIEVPAECGRTLENVSGQKVTPLNSDDESTSTYLVQITSENNDPFDASDEEQESCLKASLLYPVEHERITALAKEAVGDASTDDEKVARLITFVDQYIEDVSANPLSVFDIIDERQGDCVEHSMLFTTLARASGIPTRCVSGIMYGGEGQEGSVDHVFAFHAWNEVVLNGCWVAVDPTWRQFPVDATHIRFGHDDDSQSQSDIAPWIGKTITIRDYTARP